MRPAPAPHRSLRAVGAGVVCGLGAVVAHVLGGGATPPVWVAQLAVVTSAGVLAPLTRRRLDVAGLGAAALLAQTVLHAGFMLHDPALTQGPGAMLAAHVAAGLLTVATARSSEQAWWRLADALATLLARLLPPTPHQPYAGTRRRGAVTAARTSRPVSRAAASPRAPRGPPATGVPLALS